MRRSLGPILAVALVATALAAPPAGQRAARPKATHVVVTEAKLDAAGVVATVAPGVAVVAKAPRGKAAVVLVADAALRGTLDARALGLRLAHDAPLTSADGATLGTARTGAFVRLVGASRRSGWVVVDTVGPAVARSEVERSALTAEPREQVISGEWNVKPAVATDLMATKDGPVRARLDVTAHLLLLEGDASLAHVRTHGPFEIEGWVRVSDLAERAPADGADQVPPAFHPTHEVFTDAPLRATPGAGKVLGTLRGGTLVEKLPGPGGDVQVRTGGSVVVSGWMKPADLRELEASVWGSDVPFGR